jgi:hypothetical protein
MVCFFRLSFCETEVVASFLTKFFHPIFYLVFVVKGLLLKSSDAQLGFLAQDLSKIKCFKKSHQLVEIVKLNLRNLSERAQNTMNLSQFLQVHFIVLLKPTGILGQRHVIVLVYA